MAGDWHGLWLEKTKRRPPPDLSNVFRVQLGIVTETFHLRWIAERLGIEINDAQSRRVDPKNPWRWATIDGFDHTNKTEIETKHSNSQANIRASADFYMAQLQHTMSITGSDWMWFSVIPGNEEPMTVQVSRDQDYIDRLLDLERTFWWHVTQDVEPEILPSAKLAAAAERIPEILVGGYKADLDMARHNQWVGLCLEYAELKPKAERFEAVKKEIKELVPEDRRRCFGAGVQVIRDKKGSLSIREDKA
jgi:predicted phage-related endonuclease